MNRVVEVPDIPRETEIHLPAGVTALLVVDMQNDFAHPEGSLYGESAPAVIPEISLVLGRAREKGVPVAFTQDWHGEDDPEFAIWGEHAKAGTWGAQIVDGLKVEPHDTVIRKLRYDAFYGTSLDHLLRLWGTRHVVVTGTVANICVLHTAGSAALRYLEVVIPEDAVAALTPFDKAAALRQATFLYKGRVAPSAAIHFE
jgi:nicotinamidase-related amidase